MNKLNRTIHLILLLFVVTMAAQAADVTTSFIDAEVLTATKLNDLVADINSNDDDTVITPTAGTGIDITGVNISIQNAGVASGQIAADAIDSSKVLNESLTGNDISNGSIQAADVDSASIQLRLNSACSAGSSIRDISVTGVPTCETDDDTTYSAGPGVTIAGGSVSLTGAVSVHGSAWGVGSSTGFTVSTNGITNASGATAFSPTAAVSLPHGVTINSMTCRVNTNVTGLQIYLQRVGSTAAITSSTSIAVINPGTSTSDQYVTDSSVGYVVDNINYTYFLNAIFPNSARIASCSITY